MPSILLANNIDYKTKTLSSCIFDKDDLIIDLFDPNFPNYEIDYYNKKLELWKANNYNGNFEDYFDEYKEHLSLE